MGMANLDAHVPSKWDLAVECNVFPTGTAGATGIEKEGGRSCWCRPVSNPLSPAPSQSARDLTGFPPEPS